MKLVNQNKCMSQQIHCLHRIVLTLRERGNSDPGNPTLSGVSECITLESCLYRYRVTPSNTGRGKRHERHTLGNTVFLSINLKSGWGNANYYVIFT